MPTKTDKQLMSEQNLSVSQFKTLVREKGLTEKAAYSEQEQFRLFGADATSQSSPRQPQQNQQPGVNASDMVHATAGPVLTTTRQFVESYDRNLGQLEASAKDFLVQRTNSVLPNIVSSFLEEVNTEASFCFPEFTAPAVRRLSLPSVPAIAGNDSAAKQLSAAADQPTGQRDPQA